MGLSLADRIIRLARLDFLRVGEDVYSLDEPMGLTSNVIGDHAWCGGKMFFVMLGDQKNGLSSTDRELICNRCDFKIVVPYKVRLYRDLKGYGRFLLKGTSEDDGD